MHGRTFSTLNDLAYKNCASFFVPLSYPEQLAFSKGYTDFVAIIPYHLVCPRRGGEGFAKEKVCLPR